MMSLAAIKTGLVSMTSTQPSVLTHGLAALIDRFGNGMGALTISDAAQQHRFQVNELESELLKLNRERAVVAAENQLLNEILCHEASGAATRLLRRLIPHSADGYAALIGVSGTDLVTFATRGTAIPSESVTRVVHAELNQLSPESILRRKIPPTSAPFEIPGSVSVTESRSVMLQFVKRSQPDPEVYLIPIHDEHRLTGVLATTSLWPSGLKLNDQADTLRRFGQSVIRRLGEEKKLKEHESELHLAREMLTLKSVMDRATEQPLEVLGEFTSRLCTIADMERAALYLCSRREEDSATAAVTAGIPLPPTLVPEWSHHETVLASANAGTTRGLMFDQIQLQQFGIKTLWSSAAVWPLFASERRVGTLVLSSQKDLPDSASKRQLLQWSSDVLGETLRRIYSDAVIRRQARHDGLTDLANRRTFDSLLAGEVDRVRLGLSEECSLLLADLDRFKLINDRYGHQAGDEVLRLTAKILREKIAKMRVGERSLLARYGGEELAVLLPGVGTAGALRIAEEIREAIEAATVAFGENRLIVTLSLGVATCPRHGLKAADLLAASDAALYRAKAEGRNRVCVPRD